MDFIDFKKIVALIVAPMPLGSLLLTWALAVCWFKKYSVWLRWPLTISWLFLVGLTITPFVTNWLVDQEHFYPAYPDRPIQPVSEIMVLACYGNDDPMLPVTSQLHSCSRGRLVEALRIWYLHPDAKILLSGGGVSKHGEATQAELGARFLKALGLPPKVIHLVNHGRDTNSEAKAYKKVISSANPVLVTSATHMRRAVRLFAKHGVSVVPAPSEHLNLSPSMKGTMNWQNFVPKPYDLYRLERIWYATLANAWLTLQSLWQGKSEELQDGQQSSSTTDESHSPAAQERPQRQPVQPD